MNFYCIFLLLLVVLSAYSESPQQGEPPDSLDCTWWSGLCLAGTLGNDFVIKIIKIQETLLLSRWNNWRNQISTIAMSRKQICYPNLNYILQINSKYGLFFCLPEIDISKI